MTVAAVRARLAHHVAELSALGVASRPRGRSNE